MIRRIIGVVVLPWGAYIAFDNSPWLALPVLLFGASLVLYEDVRGRREPRVSAYRQQVRDLDERGWEIPDSMWGGIRPDAVD